MNPNPNEVFRFYELRMKIHIACVNYFAKMFGYEFPEHDNDKLLEPISSGHAYIFYEIYHKDFHANQKQIDQYKKAADMHHTSALHHINHYKDVSKIQDIHLYEMLADQAAASFENINIVNKKPAIPMEQWFSKNMLHLPWTKHQIEIIKNAFKVFEEKTDKEALKAIWQPLLEKSNL